MTNISLVIEERMADIGGFMVGRVLPFRKKRMVGPFIYLDHMGPVTLGGGENLDVLPHPHIGLATLTYLFDGALMHRDSLGSVQEIQPGAVNWMTAGRGVVHSERTPGYLRDVEKNFHGLQIWVALPKEMEQTEPAFSHIPAMEIPTWDHDGATFKLIAGEAFGRKSPMPVYSRMHLVGIKTREAATINPGSILHGESAIYIVEGGIQIGEAHYGPNKMLVLEEGSPVRFEMERNTLVYLLGGEPFPEERYIWWNFVSSGKELIEQAKSDWKAQRFPEIPGETEFVPLPL
jgi:redox-sensitive bicupin YhaK (pirin superfamily)